MMRSRRVGVWFGTLLLVGGARLLLLAPSMCNNATVQGKTVKPTNYHRNLHHIPQTNAINYKLWEPSKISSTLLEWNTTYSDFLTVYTSQEQFGLPTAGNSDDCPHDNGPGCLNYYMVIEDKAKYNLGDNLQKGNSKKELPEVLWSGELHGNEQVGPTAVMEATHVLLQSVACEALPRTNDNNPDELLQAQQCRDNLEAAGMDHNTRTWLSRLVSTRRLVVVPTANALGYYQGVREENRIDPNRDFPYDTQPSSCMTTIAARTLNEIYRQHYIQLSLTFHGGMEVIGYEWGAPSYKAQPYSPDDVAQSSIASAYSRFAGGFSKTPPYEYGPMNDLVYPVHGGMEDWAYAASWDPNLVPQCTPQTYGGYPAEKTTYDNSTLRVFNMLVETSNNKIPHTELGTSMGLFDDPSQGNGHVARNLRLALLALELVQPYTDVVAVNELDLVESAVVPGTATTCRRVNVPFHSGKTVVRWTVGGSLTVDDTHLVYARYDDVSRTLSCGDGQPAMEDYEEGVWKSATMISHRSGNTRFSKTPSPGFAASIDLSDMDQPTSLVVMAVAMVDQDWKTTKSDKPPQSHVANARTNPAWHHENDEHIIVGRLDWYSRPVVISLVETNEVETIEVSKRFERKEDNGQPADASSRGSEKPPPTPAENGNSDGQNETGSSSHSVLLGVAMLGVGALLFVGGRSYLGKKVRQSRRDRLHNYIEEEDGIFSPETEKGGYHDVKDDDELELGEMS